MELYSFKEFDIGEIVDEGLNSDIIKNICMQDTYKSQDVINKAQYEFCRFIGYCILFKSTDDIENYMLISDKNKQIDFLKEKIAYNLKISKCNIVNKKNEIIKYAYINFKKNGYVFHATNSDSAKLKIKNGLDDNIISNQQKEEILHIESIYRKYNSEGVYSPLGHIAMDISNGNTGWFYDGYPIHSFTYANSPQWFNYLCGKSYVYFNDIPEDKRNGYANKDYFTSLENVIWLVKDNNMNIDDRKEVLKFFIKYWNKYKDTTPCLIFIPVEDVGVNSDINLEQYLNEEGMNLLFDDIVNGRVNPIKNVCCKKYIAPQELSYVDLSSIFSKHIIDRKHVANKNKDNKYNEER